MLWVFNIAYIVPVSLMRCDICPLNCDKYSFCGGFIFSDKSMDRIYYNLKIKMVSIERFGLYHFLPGETTLSITTSGCNMSCLFCPEFEIIFHKSFAHNLDSMLGSIMNKIAEASPRIVGFYCNSLLDAELISNIRHHFNGNIVAISHGFADISQQRKLLSNVDGILIRFFGFSEESYSKLCTIPDGYRYAQRLLELASSLGIHTEVEFYIVPGVTDIDEFRMFIQILKNFRNPILHLKRFRPSFLMRDRSPTSARELLKFYNLAREDLWYVYGDLWHSDLNNTFCPNNHVVLRRFGWNLLENNIQKNKCRFCGVPIPGRFI